MGKCQEGNPHQNHVVMEIQYGPEFTHLHIGTQDIQYTHKHTQAFMHTMIKHLLCGFSDYIKLYIHTEEEKGNKAFVSLH